MSTKELPASGMWPDHWQNVPLWAMFDRVKDIGHPDEEMLSVYRTHGVIKKDSRDDNTNQTAENRNIYQLVDEGWLIVNRMKAWQGSVGVSSLRGIVSGHYLCFRPRHEADPRFLNWLLRSDVYTTEYARMSRGVRPGQIEIDNDELRGLRVALPTLDEQRRIADYLDGETGRLDRISDIRARQLALGFERFRQLVDGVVAGDSDALAEIEFSGSSIGWKVARVGGHFSVIPGLAFPSAEFMESRSGVRLLRGINISPGRVDWDAETAYWDLDSSPVECRFYLRRDDLVVGMDRPWINGGIRAALITGNDLPSLLLQRVACIRARAESSTRYLRWVLGSAQFRMALEGETTGISVPHISSDQIGSFVHRVPSCLEQEVIADLLQREEKMHSAQVGLMQSQLVLLAERRQALITAAVTGQIDVTTARGVDV